MYWFLFGGVIISIVLLPVFLAMGWQRKRPKKRYFPVPKGMGWLQWTAIWLLVHLPPIIRENEAVRSRVSMAADKLYPGMSKEAFCKKYQIRRMMMIYGGILAALCLLLLYGVLDREQDLTDSCIQREEAQGHSRDLEIEAEIDGVEGSGGRQKVTLSVMPRQYTVSEREALMDRVRDYIDECLAGENSSLEQVSEPIYLPDSFPGENVSIEWQPEDYNLIRPDGTLGDLTMYRLPVETTITAIIRYGDYEVQYEKNVQIVQKEKTEQEIWHDLLMAAVSDADDRSAQELQIQLPGMIEGHRVIWRYSHESMLSVLAVLAACLIICLVIYQEKALKQQLEKRNDQLIYDYPGFVHRMVLMLGAGMTVRRSLEQLLKDYEKDGSTTRKDTYLYKELKYALVQIQTGVPETQVYVNFGRRTELPQYMKFSQLLVQTIRRGSKGMQEMMMQEACEAQKQRRDMAKRLSETAGTKLLLPMMLLLIVVLFIVMVPAFLSM